MLVALVFLTNKEGFGCHRLQSALFKKEERGLFQMTQEPPETDLAPVPWASAPLPTRAQQEPPPTSWALGPLTRVRPQAPPRLPPPTGPAWVTRGWPGTPAAPQLEAAGCRLPGLHPLQVCALSTWSRAPPRSACVRRKREDARAGAAAGRKVNLRCTAGPHSRSSLLKIPGLGPRISRKLEALPFRST